MNTYTAVIRDRGQITLPTRFRDLLPWTKTNTPITIRADNQINAIILEPVTKSLTKNWDRLWQQISLARSFSGGDDVMSGSEFIAWDRQHGHRF